MTQQASEPRPTSPRLLWAAVLLLLASAGALWGASAMGWSSQRYRSPLSGERVVELSGADVRPELVPFALAALAAIAAVLATGRWLRRLIGALIAVAGGLLVWRSTTGWGAGWFLPKRGSLPSGGHPVGELATNPAGPVLMALGGLVLVGAGLLVVLRARRMPAMGAKYSAPGAQKPRVQDPDRRLWDALDAGADPTEDERDR